MPVARHVYAARKAQGLCVYHPTRLAVPGRTLCEGCLQQRRDYQALSRSPAAQRTSLVQQRMRATGLRVVPPRPVPAPAERLLLCCGTWWTITHIPLLVPCCHRRWLVATPDPDTTGKEH